jgi:hypothetical protein
VESVIQNAKLDTCTTISLALVRTKYLIVQYSPAEGVNAHLFNWSLTITSGQKGTRITE